LHPYNNFQKLRNDIVHRGRLSMPEVDELRRKESNSFLRSVFEGEAPLQSQKALSTAVALAARRKTFELRIQYAATIRMLNQVGERVKHRVLNTSNR
jgi:hypothetical protein